MVTVDAMRCQRANTGQTIDKKADYMLAGKRVTVCWPNR